MIWRFPVVINLSVLAGCGLVQPEDIERSLEPPPQLEPRDSITIDRPSLTDRHPPKVLVTPLGAPCNCQSSR